VNRFLELIVDTQTVQGRLVTSGLVIVLATLVAGTARRLFYRRFDDTHSRYYARKGIRFVTVLVTLVILAAIWRAFAGRAAIIIGFAAAGLTFAMQEVIGAAAGWFNIISGRIFKVGDRIQMAGVRGDVIDLTPLRTKIIEMGSPQSDESWVKGRQYTGRIVTVSNKATFTEPVFNYSAIFDFIWEEVSIPVPHTANWERAEEILREEAEKVSQTGGAQAAMREIVRKYPVPRAEVEPKVFVRATDNWMELSARFVIPVRTARSVRDGLTRSVVERLKAEGIPIASETQDITVELAGKT
jgi:small-conductance mechanosensitive channel